MGKEDRKGREREDDRRKREREDERWVREVRRQKVKRNLNGIRGREKRRERNMEVVEKKGKRERGGRKKRARGIMRKAWQPADDRGRVNMLPTIHLQAQLAENRVLRKAAARKKGGPG